jgi:hypothetical protein
MVFFLYLKTVQQIGSGTFYVPQLLESVDTSAALLVFTTAPSGFYLRELNSALPTPTNYVRRE